MTVVTPGTGSERVAFQYTSTLEGTVGSTACAKGRHRSIAASSHAAEAVLLFSLRSRFIALFAGRLRRNGERDLTGLRVGGAVDHRQHRGIVSRAQLAVPFHFHGILLSGKKA